jgi:hypothetical protein
MEETSVTDSLQDVGPRVATCDYAQFTTSPHAQSWILGDTLQCVEFQNHAMGLLYSTHRAPSAPRAVSPADVALALDRSPSRSLLKDFYLHFIATHFNDKERIFGTTKEWDTAPCDHASARKAVLVALRSSVLDRRYMKTKRFYMVIKKDFIVETASIQCAATVVPAKRNADGVPVKKELTSVFSKMIGGAATPSTPSAAEELSDISLTDAIETGEEVMANGVAKAEKDNDGAVATNPKEKGATAQQEPVKT